MIKKRVNDILVKVLCFYLTLLYFLIYIFYDFVYIFKYVHAIHSF